ncbi:hypothetical protein [Streptomyces gobiensis]|uniref:hypothetical protein n=1 Tax=Streptomyces gobiensis TaxID=2875706 RepID=UPI001E52413A|nr:hypothetical protein [Streptomyces gobiensis]UGY93370.1 hypothetical protein test1122_17725 [Streptomyces gobiensis]
MKTRRARLLPVAASVLALGLVSACGGSGSGDGNTSGDAKNDKVSSAPTKESAAPDEDSQAAPAKALSEGELNKAALATADVSGFTVKTPSKEEVSGAGEEKAKSPECQPIASVIGGVPQPEPNGLVYRQLLSTSEDEDAGGLILFEMLAAYEQRSAERMLGDLRKAMKACSGGFSTTSAGETNRYTTVRELTAPTGADDALAYEVVGDLEGDKVPLLFNVVRSGSTVAIFYSMNLMDSSKAEVPKAVVTAQINKLK